MLMLAMMDVGERIECVIEQRRLPYALQDSIGCEAGANEWIFAVPRYNMC